MKLFTLLTSFALLTLTSTSNSAAPKVNLELSSVLHEAAISLNTQVPMKLDEETQLDSVATFANYMIYNNTMINYDANMLDVAIFTASIEENVIGGLCANPSLAFFIEQKVVMVYRYIGKDGVYITEASKDMGTCK